jgi:signal transduction histidine kinase
LPKRLPRTEAPGSGGSRSGEWDWFWRGVDRNWPCRKASRVEIVTSVEDSRLTLTVADDGIGISSTAPRSGLENARARAADLGGELRLEESPLKGARLVWTVPLAR